MEKTRNIAWENINQAWREYINSEHKYNDDTFQGPTDELKRVYGEYLKYKRSKQKHDDSMSDTETVDLCKMSCYDVMETRLKCLELAIKVLSIADVAECEVTGAKLIAIAQKFTDFVLKDVKMPNHLCAGQN